MREGSMSRQDAAAQAIAEQDRRRTNTFHQAQARDALAAADAHDAANGVHRVRLDSEGMKRALEAVDTFTELVYDSFAGKERDDLVRAIIRAAAVKEGQ
jgi:hypothetical protein